MASLLTPAGATESGDPLLKLPGLANRTRGADVGSGTARSRSNWVIVRTGSDVSRSSDGRRAGVQEYEPQRPCSFQHER